MQDTYNLNTSSAVTNILALKKGMDDLNISVNKTRREYEAYNEKGRVILQFIEQQVAGGKTLIQTNERVGASVRVLRTELTTLGTSGRAALRSLREEALLLAKTEIKGFDFLPQNIRSAQVAIREQILTQQKVNRGLAPQLGTVGTGGSGQFTSRLGAYDTSPFAKVAQGNKEVVEKSAAAVEKANSRILLSYQSVLRIVQAQILFRIIAEAVNELNEAVKTATEFSKRLAEIQTISQSAGVSNAVLAENIKSVS